MLNKLKALSFITFVGGTPASVIPSLSMKDKNIKTITLEGSSSLYEPIEVLGEIIESQLELSILPTGSEGGKESHNQKSIDFALTSMTEGTPKWNNPLEPLPLEKEKKTKQIILAKDPLVFLYKEHKNCKSESIKYQPPIDVSSSMPPKILEANLKKGKEKTNSGGATTLIIYMEIDES